MTRKKRRRKQQKESGTGLAGTAGMREFGERVREHIGPGLEHLRILPPRSQNKVSAMILEIAQPWLDEMESETIEEVRSIIGATVAGWNVAILERRDGKNKEEILQQYPGVVHSMIEHAIDEKQLRFPELTEMIAHYEVVDNGDEWNLRVAYADEDRS